MTNPPSPRTNAGLSRLLSTVLGSPFVLPEDTLDNPPPLTLERTPSPAPSADYSFISRSVEYPSRWSMQQQSPFRALLPRIWEVLSSPTRNLLAMAPFEESQFYTDKNRSFDSDTDYSSLLPLDGEEGELIEDEACFVAIHSVTGFDILAQLPPELALNVLSYLFTPNEPCTTATRLLNAQDNLACSPFKSSPAESLQALFACLGVSRTWRRLASDSSVWKAAFTSRWTIDKARVELNGPPLPRTPRTSSSLILDSFTPTKQTGSLSRVKKLALSRSTSFSSLRRSMSSPINSRPHTPTPASHRIGPLNIDWKTLYQQRLDLERRWGDKKYEPKVMRLAGHTDSVYCLEFDEVSSLVITGSRDRTIKVWSLKSGRLLGTFAGAHRGSVLCLKFEPESFGSTDLEQDSFCQDPQKVFMVSGSSDTTVCVWDLDLVPAASGYERSPRTVRGTVRKTLKGHAGGVLDIRMDKRWIVSCSKDGLIRVWDRATLQSVRTLVGHEGPVNAVAFQSSTGRVVSASGDNKMILWDIETGARLRTFEGHDRCLACIEFKGDLIVSGSNDCKIKVWSVDGECLRTLVGHESLVRALSYDPSTGLLVSASYDRSIKVWDIRTGKMLREFKTSHTSHIFDVKFDCRRIVSTSHDQRLVVHDFSNGLSAATLFV